MLRHLVLHRFTAPLAVFSLALVAGCSDDDTAPPTDTPQATSLLDRAAKAMGGRAAIEAVTSERVESTGQRFDAGEATRFGEIVHIADFHTTCTADARSPRVRKELSNETKYLLPLSYQYTDIVDGEHGWVDGVDDLLEMAAGPGAPTQQPMPASRVTAQLRQAELASPIRLLQRALAGPATEEGGALVLEGGVTLHIDPTTFLPTRAVILEDQPPLGDVVVEYVYGDYRDAGGVMAPHALDVVVDELTIHSETRAKVETSVALTDDAFAVPEPLTVPFDPALSAYGERSTQLLLGWQHLGFTLFYYDQSGAPSTFVELAPGVEYIVGPSHHSLLVEMADGLIIVDTPLYEGRSRTVLDEIAARHPDKPVDKLVASHFHFDHVGGVRTYAARGGVTLYAGAPSVEFFERVFESEHTVASDAFAEDPQEVTIEGVSKKTTLTDGTMVVELYPIETTHADDMLVVYLPAHKLLFNADLFNPDPATAGLPSPGDYGVAAGELYDAVTALGLEIDAIVGTHGPASVATLDDLRAAAGR
jgi:glyoxylase-like metal-dependent hydrolase (beta-lactamase superfamily II)